MALSRVASVPLSGRLIDASLRLQARMSEAQTQQATGLKSVDYKGISRDAQRLLAIESTQDQLTAYSQNGILVGNQVNIAYDTFGSMDGLANTVLTGLTAALGGDLVDPTVTTAQAQIALNEFASLLNTRVGERALFGGIDIDTTPVNTSDPGWPPQTTPSTPNFNYYQGSSTPLTAQLSETLTVTYSVQASNPAFEGILRSFNLIVNNPGNKAAYAEAFTLLKSNIDNLASIRGQLASTAKTIDDQNSRNEEDIANLATVVGSLKEVDLAAATVNLKNMQTQLEASYSASVVLLRLSLTNYL